MVLKALELLASGFEGAEKVLEIDVLVGEYDALSICTDEWAQILEACDCTILSECESQGIRAYLLSESALIITRGQIRLNTCGATRLLQCLMRLMATLHKYSLPITFVQYERSNFLFTERQPLIHRAFRMESEFLRLAFADGKSFAIGTHDEPSYHVFVADLSPDVGDDEQVIQVIMFDLEPSVLKQFYVANNANAYDMMKMAGIAQLIDANEFIVDAHAYEPCGLSINALRRDASAPAYSHYYTIHVTPEDEFSYISFRTSVPYADYAELVRQLTRVFRPGRMALMLYIYSGDINAVDDDALTDIGGYNCVGRTALQLAARYRALSMQFVSSSSSSSSLLFGHNALSRRTERKQPLDIDSGSDTIVCVGYNLARTLKQRQLKALIRQAVLQRVPVDKLIDYADDIDMRSMCARKPSAFIINIDTLADRVWKWCTRFPRIHPYYELMCNSEVGVVLALNAIGCGFSCVSMHDIRTALDLGVSPHRMLFERVWKGVRRIRYARDQQIPMMSFSQANELRLIAKYYPDAWLLLHVSAQSNERMWSDGVRGDIGQWGANVRTCEKLMSEAMRIGARVVGVRVSFMRDDDAAHTLQLFRKGVERAANVLRMLRQQRADNDDDDASMIVYISSRDLWIELDEQWEAMVECMNTCFDANTRILADPSQFLVKECATLCVSVIGRRQRRQQRQRHVTTHAADDDGVKYVYYVSDGVYGSLSCVLYQKLRTLQPCTLYPASAPVYPSRLFGPTCDTVDSIADNIMLPELQLGDILYFKNMGAYASSSATTFNGIEEPDVWYTMNMG